MPVCVSSVNRESPDIVRWCQTMAPPVSLYGCWTWNDQSKVFCYSIWIFANAKPPAEIQDSLTNAGFRLHRKVGDRIIYIWYAPAQHVPKKTRRRAKQKGESPDVIRWCKTMAIPFKLYANWEWLELGKIYGYSVWIEFEPTAEIQAAGIEDSLKHAGFRFSHKDGDRFIYVWQAILSKYESDHGQEREHEPK